MRTYVYVYAYILARARNIKNIHIYTLIHAYAYATFLDNGGKYFARRTVLSAQYTGAFSRRGFFLVEH